MTIYYPSSGRGVERGNLGSLFPPTGGLKKSGILVSDLKSQGALPTISGLLVTRRSYVSRKELQVDLQADTLR